MPRLSSPSSVTMPGVSFSGAPQSGTGQSHIQLQLKTMIEMCICTYLDIDVCIVLYCFDMADTFFCMRIMNMYIDVCVALACSIFLM